MVFTIHRYIFRDLLKTFLLATLVLSGVLGLGVMLRPLQEFNVDPIRVPELLLCTLPITLTMVLPIAALLAATLCYGRMSSDNEITTCRSSGIGLMTLIYPALALALLVGMATLLLGFHVIPSYAQKIESILKDDAEAIVFRNIEKKGYLGDLASNILIHADKTWPKEHLLEGVVVAVMDGWDIERIISARLVEVNFKVGHQSNEVLLRLHDASVVSNDSGLSGTAVDPVISLQVPSFWKDKITFKKLADLKAIQNEDMTLFTPVRKQLEKVRRQLTVELFFEWCHQKLVRNGYVDLQQGFHRLRLYGRGCRLRSAKDMFEAVLANKNRTAMIEGEPESVWPVRVEYFYRWEDGQYEKEYRAKSAQLSADFAEGVQENPQSSARETGMLLLKETEVSETGYREQRDSPRLASQPFTPISLPEEVAAAAEGVYLSEVLEGDELPLRGEPSAYLSGEMDELRSQCRQLATEIEVEVHSRLAFGVSCVVLVLLGTALGIWFRSGNLLTAFGISFIPAALCMVTIFTGKHIAEQSSMGVSGGVMFLWSGIVLVGLCNVLVYKVALKH